MFKLATIFVIGCYGLVGEYRQEDTALHEDNSPSSCDVEVVTWVCSNEWTQDTDANGNLEHAWKSLGQQKGSWAWGDEHRDNQDDTHCLDWASDCNG